MQSGKLFHSTLCSEISVKEWCPVLVISLKCDFTHNPERVLMTKKKNTNKQQQQQTKMFFQKLNKYGIVNIGKGI